jgi:hypothetical protein
MEEQAWWIANLRIAFPKLDIQCGIWEDRIERISYLLDAGSNSISKFKALKLFGTSIARQIEEQATLADRKFVGTLSKMPEIDWNQKINSLEISKDLKRDIRKKLDLYLQKMTSNQ